MFHLTPGEVGYFNFSSTKKEFEIKFQCALAHSLQNLVRRISTSSSIKILSHE